MNAADPMKIAIRDLSCFCALCQMRDWKACENTSHVQPLKLVTLKTHIPWHVRDVMQRLGDGDDSQNGFDGANFADLLELGDNYAIPALLGNVKGVEFYLLACQRPKFWVEMDFKYKWGNSF